MACESLMDSDTEMESDFASSMFNRGYSKSVLRDYDDSEEKGKTAGYDKALELSNEVHKEFIDLKVNPINQLSHWVGALTAVHHIHSESSRRHELVNILSELKQYIKIYSDFKFPDDTKDYRSYFIENDSHKLEVSNLFKKCRIICKELNCNMPLNDEK